MGPPPYRSALRWGGKQGMVERADGAYGKVLKAMGRRLFRSCTLQEVGWFFAANQFCASRLYPQWMAFDGRQLGRRFQVPVVVIQGEDDLMAPIGLVKAWLEEIEAPLKRLVPLKAGHLSMFTRPDAFLQALLQEVRPLAAEPLPSRGGAAATMEA
jgi:pimeloyl-ACP methyl ester carboxylesterase